LKKVAVVGAVGYTAYKIGQLSNRFNGHSFGDNYNPGYNFNQWKTWRKADGFLCRNDNDCNWLDRNLECDRVQDFGWTINDGWFGGNEKPVGECDCQNGMRWDDDDLRCENWYAPWYVAIGLSFGLMVFLFILGGCCCCAVCFFAAKKFLN